MDNLLRERALALEKRRSLQSEELATPYLVFLLSEESYALPLAQLSGVVRVERLTPVPGSRFELSGLMNVRGEVRPLYDLKRLLGRETEERNESPSRALLASISDLAVCFRVDQVVDLLRVREVDGRVAGLYSIGRTAEGVTLLDLALLCRHPLFREVGS